MGLLIKKVRSFVCLTGDVRLMTKTTVEVVARIYRPGFKYSKTQVLLVNLCQIRRVHRVSLFDLSNRSDRESDGVLDARNRRWGSVTIASCQSIALMSHSASVTRASRACGWHAASGTTLLRSRALPRPFERAHLPHLTVLNQQMLSPLSPLATQP